jgi:hypothetical protein
MRWHKDARKVRGGYWRCFVKERESDRERYANDPIYRISHNLKSDARKRATTLKRMEERLNGEIPN